MSSTILHVYHLSLVVYGNHLINVFFDVCHLLLIVYGKGQLQNCPRFILNSEKGSIFQTLQNRTSFLNLKLLFAPTRLLGTNTVKSSIQKTLMAFEKMSLFLLQY
jgi:hypothetical protein